MNSIRISVTQAQGTWVVRAGGAVIGESNAALELVIGDQAPVIYFPREGIGMALLDTSATTTQSPELGDAEYFSIVTRSTVLQDAAWSYTAPHPEAARLAGHLTFDPLQVTIERV